MGKIGAIEEIAIEKLRPYERNAKIHGATQVEKLKSSIKEFGFLTPCLIDQDFNLIAGHGRLMAAKELKMQTIPCVFIEGLSEDERKAYILADNRLSELGEWDMDLVSEELKALSDNGFNLELTGFDFDDITSDDIDFSDLDEKGNRIEETMPEEPTTQKGELFKLGRHYLMCGDSTKAEDVKRLMGDELADLIITDPPYNIDYEGKTKEALKIKNDNMSEEDFYDFLCKAFDNLKSALKIGGGYYIWLPSTGIDIFIKALKKHDLEMKQLLIWVKNVFSLGRQDYQWRHEPCIYGWKEGAAHYFTDDRRKSTVFEKKIDVDSLTEKEAKKILKGHLQEVEKFATVIHENKPSRSEAHPTMKPVALLERQIENSSRVDDLILDLFGGSGSTLIACQNKRRRCKMMEFDPHYCDVIIKRWEDLTGEKAEKVDDH